ncbi:hypothetical protein F8568_011295 [Actinomadura sp. LD22]|uniref:MftR C-terminal domain-containing protein n=1 Tax=Actinomadura physcomitrii TaxID=2650748 RepID=A0A6I4M4G1_9ACTN|nr:hypothetical protein [Actinomadura physcomitrii]MWA00958.1 hypothetical protein [Actinomadura physcomitrii]
MSLQRRLEIRPPALDRSAQTMSEQFRADLHDWVTARAGADDLTAILQLNLALAASNTAYQTWPADESFDDYLRRVDHCLHRATPVAAASG